MKMSSFPLISVIVPIYGIECYIGMCIESIIKQSYKNLEIILVDDGSLDKSGQICDLYALKDSRIRVIHKENGGLVSARKAGLEAATGEYVGYVDGDDWIEQGFYENLYNEINESNADLVVAGHSRDLFYLTVEIASKIPSGRYKEEKLTEVKKKMLSFGSFFQVGITTYVWNKLFKRSMLLECQYGVNNRITIGEDAAVVYPYIMKCEKISVIDDFSYHYRQREDSMLKQNNAYENELLGIRELYNYLNFSLNKFDEEYQLKKQIEEFVLGLCVIRSGGILKETRKNNFPYKCNFENKNIVIYSAGTFGQQLYKRILEKNYCSVVGWIDSDCWEYRRCCMNVDSISEIDSMEFDYILIATLDPEIKHDIKDKLVWRGIEENKILIVDYQASEREILLKNFLGV